MLVVIARDVVAGGKPRLTGETVELSQQDATRLITTGRAHLPAKPVQDIVEPEPKRRGRKPKR